jgi:RsiW-degrading membrane proteinase PrsW (M82 family)
MKKEVVIQLHKPNINEMLFFFASGAIISVPLTLFVDQLADNLLIGLTPFYATLISVAVFAPFIEEFSKAFPLFYRHGETERSIFKLGLLVGLGFGLVELITYVFAIGAPVLNRLPGLFFHPASTSITAYGIATKRVLPFYLIAVTFHLSNNFFAVTNPFAVPISGVIVAIIVFASVQLYGKTKERMVS